MNAKCALFGLKRFKGETKPYKYEALLSVLGLRVLGFRAWAQSTLILSFGAQPLGIVEEKSKP